LQTKDKNKKINVITLGCSKNIVDSEVLMGQLKAANVEVIHDSADSSDAVVINTCGFIGDAKEESIEVILENVEAKKAGHVDKVYVMGCLSERYKKELEDELEMVDGFYGTTDLPRIVKELGVDYKQELVGERMLTTPCHYAYMKISEGCNRTCSFCAIPLMRGKHISKPESQVIDEARMLVSQGVKEIILIAQELTYYGVDISQQRTLPRLLEKLAGVEGLEWIRLQYAYPADFPLEIIDVMREHPNICNYLDMPLQHISDPILKSMRRFINSKRTLTLLDEIRNRLPEIALRSTLIVGYPGEELSHFEELKKFVTDQEFDRLGVFTYSHEENTRAYELADTVTEAEKVRRMEEIMDLQQDISLRKNQSKVGKSLKVLIDRQEGEYFVGRTEIDSPEVDNEVLIKGKPDIRIGEFYNASIISADFFDLYAE
jgi:ribosomal protein S12 methylthiotransferase